MPELSRFYVRMLSGWLAVHEDEVYAAWSRAVSGEEFGRIEPL